MTPLWVLVNSLQQAPFGTHYLGKWAEGSFQEGGAPQQDVEAWRPEEAEIKGG